MNDKNIFEPMELVTPMQLQDVVAPTTVSVECDTGYTCKVGKAEY